MPKNDIELRRSQECAEEDTNVNYDRLNEEILWFCSQLFHQWLEDYEVAAEKVQDQTGMHNLYYLNEGVRKNIRD